MRAASGIRTPAMPQLSGSGGKGVTTHATLTIPLNIARLVAQMSIMLVATTSIASAQATGSSPAGEHVLLGTILDAVERANPRIDAARALASAAVARVPSVSRLPDPEVQLGWMNRELFSLRAMPVLGMTQLQVMQMVPTAGKLRLAGELESSRANVVAQRAAEVALDLRSRAAMAFYDLYSAERALVVMRDSRRLVQDLAEAATRMYEVGEGRQSDVLRANVELARMDEDIIRMEAMSGAMRERLNALMLRQAGSPLGTPRLPAFPSVTVDVDTLAVRANSSSPMIRIGATDGNHGP